MEGTGQVRNGQADISNTQKKPRSSLPRLSVGVLFTSAAMKDDSVCLRTVSFHILLIRL